MPLVFVGVDVFIIHAAPDTETALLLREALAEIGVSAFVDKSDAPAGEPWDVAMLHELRQSLLQVVLLGESIRWYQHEEIDIAIREMRAHDADDRVVPVLLKKRALLPYGLNRVQALDWDGPNRVAARLGKKVAALRGIPMIAGRLATSQRQVKIAVLGFHAELPEALETLRRRIGQRTAILDGEVQRVDLMRDAVPEVDLRVVLLGSQHGGKLALIHSLVAADRRDAAARDTIVGAIDVPLRQVPGAHKAEAIDMQSLDVAITSTSIESVIDALDDNVASWHAARFPSHPGMSVTREPWEKRYLADKAPLWRKGDPSALRALGGARVDRIRWYVHLKAGDSWSELQPWLDWALSRESVPRCVVVGSAGTGKTVLLQHLAWVLATDDEPGPPDEPVHRVDRAGVRGKSPTRPVPILHSAATLAAYLRGDRPIREVLVELPCSSETFGRDVDAAALRGGIDVGRYVFLIDSLDEVPRREDREALVAALGTLTGPSPRVILTTRPSAYTAVELPEGFERVDIAPLDDDAIRRLTQAWIACWTPRCRSSGCAERGRRREERLSGANR
ncbi:MAG TPA: TIR domain-containing protein [Kofleriaceae bacterium]